MSLTADPKIVIIGCGISGIAAAHRLVKAGFQHVRILEATARSGGRIKTDRLGEARYLSICVCVCLGGGVLFSSTELY